MQASPDPDGAGYLTVRVVSNESSAVIEAEGTLSRATAAHLWTELMGLIHDTSMIAMSVAVDLSGISSSDGSLFVVLARAHTALKARRGHLYLIVADDEMLGLVHAAGFERITPVFMAREYRDRLEYRVEGRAPARVARRQQVIDLRDASRGSGRKGL